MVQQGSITVEREIRAGIVASATYLMNLDRQLPNSVDINIAPATATKMFQLQGGTGATGVRDGETFVVPFYSQRVNTGFGPVTDIVSNADATYNAMVLEARRRLREALNFEQVGRGQRRSTTVRAVRRRARMRSSIHSMCCTTKACRR